MSGQTLIGQTLDGRYQIKALLGKGGMAMVYRAHQPAMGRDVAVKMILPDVGSGADFVERFKNEAQIVARLEHPHILPVYDFGDYREQAYLVMRLLEAGDLQEFLKDRKLSLTETNRLIGQLASALTYAHNAGIVHRDLKPQNVLMDSGGNPYLTDFGIAKAIGQTGHQMTQTGTIMGTPSYMAPEQWRTEAVDARTDIYALGIMAYFMLTGYMPFEAENQFGLMYMHLGEMPDPLEKKKPGLPANLTAVIFTAIAKKQSDRFDSAVDFARALDDAIRDPNSYMRDKPGSEHATVVPGADPFRTQDSLNSLNTRPSLSGLMADENTLPPGISYPGITNKTDLFEPPSPTVSTLPPGALQRQQSPSYILIGGVIAMVAVIAVLLFVLLRPETETPSGNNNDIKEMNELDTPIGPTDTPDIDYTGARVVVGRGVLFDDPRPDANDLGTVPEGEEVRVLGYTPDEGWFRVEFSGLQGWIAARQIGELYGNLSEVGVIVSPTPLPTDTPTETATATVTPLPTDTPTETPVPSDTPTITLTPTDTPTETPTPSDTPTETPTPSDTPSPTASDTPSKATGTALQQAPIFELPDATSRQLVTAPVSSEMDVIGVMPDGSWYQVRYLGQTGWVFAELITVTGNLSTVFTPTPSDTPTETPSPTPTDTPTATSTFTPSPTFTFTPSPTSPVATPVACILTAFTANARTINVFSLPRPNAPTIDPPYNVGESFDATARTLDGWYLTLRGWVFDEVVDESSPFVCGSLPLINIDQTAETIDAGDEVCTVRTAGEAVLHRGASQGTTPVISIPINQDLSVYEVVIGEDGRTWYRTVWTDPNAIVFQGWIIEDAAGSLAGSCPTPPSTVSLFGNPDINPLGLTTAPTFSDNFDENTSNWALLAALGVIEISDGTLKLTLQERETTAIHSTAPAMTNELTDGFITMRLTVPPGFGEEYTFETIVRGYYSVRVGETGSVVVAAEANPSLQFGATPDGVADLQQGITLGIEMRGNVISVYINGEKVLEAADNSSNARLSGIFLRFRVTNRVREGGEPLTLLMDDFAYWDFAE